MFLLAVRTVLLLLLASLTRGSQYDLTLSRPRLRPSDRVRRHPFASPFLVCSCRLGLIREGAVEGPPLSVNVRVHGLGEVSAGTSPEALGVSRHQLLRDVSPRRRSGSIVIRPLDEELRSSVLHSPMPE